METLTIALELVRRHWQRIGPYLLIELLLPGGSLIALALFLCRQRNRLPAPAWAFARRVSMRLPRRIGA